jgi:hypothetical protein
VSFYINAVDDYSWCTWVLYHFVGEELSRCRAKGKGWGIGLRAWAMGCNRIGPWIYLNIG